MTEYLIAIKPHETLIDAVLRRGEPAFFASCGGKGTCGRCRVYCSSHQLNALTNMERKRLTPEERAAGIRLACQIRNPGSETVTITIQV